MERLSEGGASECVDDSGAVSREQACGWSVSVRRHTDHGAAQPDDKQGFGEGTAERAD